MVETAFSIVDEMLENEQKNSSDRISSLEKHVKLQNDEIVCLKSALADVIRRIQQIESTQQQQHQVICNQINGLNKLPLTVLSKTKKPTMNRKTSRDSIGQDGKTLQNSISSEDQKSKEIKPSLASKLEKAKESSTSNSHLNNSLNEKHLHNSKSSNKALQHSNDSYLHNQHNNNNNNHHNQSLVFNSDTGSVKFFIRGRPITLYLPNSEKVSENSNEIGFKFDPEAKLKAPKEKLKLEWVYGYRGKDCRSNLYQLPTGEIIYFIAAICVLYNVDEQTQRHYLGHTDDVKSIAIHPDKITIATGQSTGHEKLEGRCHVRIWDSLNLTTLKVIGLNGNEFQNFIGCISFSKVDGGEKLVVTDEKSLSVWNWQSCQKITSTKYVGDMVFAAEFHPSEKNLIVTTGKQHIYFWILDGQNLTKKSGSFEISPSIDLNNSSTFRNEKPKYVLCIAFASSGEIISGDSEGNLIFWSPKDFKISRVLKDAHEGGVFSILVLQNQVNSNESSDNLNNSNTSGSSAVTMITGGGKDGKLYEWNQDYHKTGRVIQIPEANGACRFISNSKGNNLIMVGTTKNCIFQANFDLNYMNCIINTHFEELWGLCMNPRENTFLTCGNDKHLFYWDILSHGLIWSVTLEDPLHCVDIHPINELAAISCYNKSKWIVFDLSERKIIFSQIEGNEQIEVVAYSPNGAYLACGSRDNFIYIYSVSENGTKYSRLGRLTGHSSFITHIDWSVDSEYLMSNSGDYEVLIWNVLNCKQVTNVQQIREIAFKKNNCKLSFNTLGIWNSNSVESIQNGTSSSSTSLSYDGTDINACACSKSKKLLCSVDDFGKVNLFQYPCNMAKAEKRVYQGHSSHITNVSFINNDTRLVTIGGNDMSILQWAVIDE